MPGVHANAERGDSAIATNAIATVPNTQNIVERQPVGPRVTLYAEPLALPAYRLAKVPQLGLHDVRDLLAG